MRWTWNRWTILAIILLLSTAVGLPFRPWGDGFEGKQIVEHLGLTLTCPESLSASLGERRSVRCEFTEDLENRDDYLFDAYGDIEEIATGRYTLVEEFSVDTSGAYEVKVDRTATEEAFLLFRDNITDPRFSRPSAHAVATIDVRTQYHPIFYMGLGLTWFLTLVLLGGPLVAIVALALRRFKPTGSLLAKANHALNESPISDWLVRPWLYAVSVRAISNARPQGLLRSYMATDSLWNVYFLMAIMIIPFRTLHIFHSQTTGWPEAGVELTVAITLSIIGIVVLMAIRHVTFFNVVNPYWGLINLGNVEQERPQKWVNSGPFAFTALVGLFSLVFVADYYWTIWV